MSGRPLERLDSDIAAFEFRRRYLPIFRQVLNGKITATFFQVEHRINTIIDLQLTSQMLWHESIFLPPEYLSG